MKMQSRTLVLKNFFTALLLSNIFLAVYARRDEILLGPADIIPFLDDILKKAVSVSPVPTFKIAMPET